MSNTKRVAIILVTLLFAFTALAGAGSVIYQLVSENNSDSDAQEVDSVSQALEEATNNNQTNETPEEDTPVLQGTKLENFEPRSGVAELEIIDLKEGDGEVVEEGASVTAHYTGALVSDGTIFQSSYDSGAPVPFSLSGVIEGWTEGVPGMKVGGVRRLVIPAEKAYGASPPSPDIPANADLVFDITLVSVQQ